MVSKGFYRHYKGHLYFVHGVGCDKHDEDHRMVVYTSVKTIEGDEGFDFLLRDEQDFEARVYKSDGLVVGSVAPRSKDPIVRRFTRVINPEKSIVPELS